MKFNPLTDLTVSQRDTAVKQLGGITGTEIGNLASSLRTASQRTSQIVDVLRRDNTKTNSDLNKIMDLDRRLKRVIPIIPEKFGEAGNIYADKQPIPKGGLSLPRLPKFPKIPILPTPSLQPQTQPQTQPQPQTQTEPQRQPGFEWPSWLPIPPIPLPNPEDLLPQVVAANTSIVNKINDIAFKVGDDLVALSKLQPKGGKYQPMSPMEQLELVTMAAPPVGFGYRAAAMFVANPAVLRLLSKVNPRLFQRLFPAAPVVARGGRTSTYGDIPIGPQPARPMAKPGPLRPDQVTPRAAKIPTPPATSSNLYDELLKSTRFGISSMGEVGARLGGTRALRRAPLMKRFDTGGIFRQGPLKTADDRAMIEALREIGLDKEIAKISDPSNIYSQRARAEVLRNLGLVDETFERITSGTKITKKATTSMRVLKSPRDFMNSFMEGDVVIPSGSVADILGLNNDALRKRFGYYLLQAPPGKKEQYANFIYKISKGLGIIPGKSVNQLDDSTVKFLMRFFRPSASASTDIRPGIFQKLKDKNFIDKDRLFGDFLSLDDIKNLKDPAQIPGVPDPKLLSPGAEVLGPRSSVIGKPGTMDLASLGIDTSVEIQEIYYIVG